jgi:uncharacterized protein YaaQ
MKMIIAIVWDTDDQAVVQQLVNHGYRVTRVASTGGFLRHGMVTLLIGVDSEKVQTVIDLVRDACRPPVEANQHRATVFVVNMPHFEQI